MDVSGQTPSLGMWSPRYGLWLWRQLFAPDQVHRGGPIKLPRSNAIFLSDTTESLVKQAKIGLEQKVREQMEKK